MEEMVPRYNDLEAVAEEENSDSDDEMRRPKVNMTTMEALPSFRRTFYAQSMTN